jgi:hypothetical protein
MNKEQAEELAANIKAQFPFHVLIVRQAGELHHIAPHDWVIYIKPSEDYQGESLRIQSEDDWHQALLAWQILRD